VHDINAPTSPSGLFVVTSELRVRPDASQELVEAFRDRAHLVDARDEFDHLEVWRDQADAGRFMMTSWWASRAAFVDYMRSDDHRRSHARITHGPGRPRPVQLCRFDIVAT
jgi:heme oxygenase (mycobilin-producing)